MSPQLSEIARDGETPGSGTYPAKSAYGSASLPLQKPVLTLPPPSSSGTAAMPYYSLTPQSYYPQSLSSVFLHTAKLQYNGFTYLDPFSYPVSQPHQLLLQSNLGPSLARRSPQPPTLQSGVLGMLNMQPNLPTNLQQNIQQNIQAGLQTNVQTNAQANIQPPQLQISQFSFQTLGLVPGQLIQPPGQRLMLLGVALQGLNTPMGQNSHSVGLSGETGANVGLMMGPNNLNSSMNGGVSLDSVSQSTSQNMTQSGPESSTQSTSSLSLSVNSYSNNGVKPLGGILPRNLRPTENGLSLNSQPITSDDLFVFFKDLSIFKGKSPASYSGKMFSHSKHTKAPGLFHEPKDPDLYGAASDSKPYKCTFEGCSRSFARQLDLRRHTKSHKEPMFHCPYWRLDPTCHRNGGSFSRLDMLKRHLRLVHYVKDKQQIFPGSDPGWCRACQKMFHSSKHFMEHCVDCANQISPAEWRTTPKAKESQEIPGST